MIDVLCKDCKEVGPPEVHIEYQGLTPTEEYHFCGHCGSDNIQPVDEIAAAEEYLREDR